MNVINLMEDLDAMYDTLYGLAWDLDSREKSIGECRLKDLLGDLAESVSKAAIALDESVAMISSYMEGEQW